MWLTTILLTAPVVAQQRPVAPARPEARDRPNRSSENRSAERWLQQLVNDLDHLQDDLYYERGTYPQGLMEQVDQVSYAVAHFQQMLGKTNDQKHLQRDFQEMDEAIHKLVRSLDGAGDSWLRRQASRIRYSDEQLHYSLQRKLEDPRAPSRELLARQAHLLENEAHVFEELAERVNRQDRRLREAIDEFVADAEHFHEVVEKGADSKHVHKDFDKLDESWHGVVQRLNSSSYIYYLRNAAQNVNRVHNQIHEMVAGGHQHGHEHVAAEKTVPVNPPPARRPAIQFEIPGVGRFQIPQ